MGKEVIKVALKRNHSIELIVDETNLQDLNIENLKKTNVIIEFTNPQSAVVNYINCFKARVPVVSGTTGWLEEIEYVKKVCGNYNATFFYASNFSLGVNILFEMNKQLAKIMSSYNNYNPEIEEIHHKHKKDAPSGTAISLAKGILQHNSNKSKWVNNINAHSDELLIISKRLEEVPGIHTIKYNSDVDTLTLKHEAKSREGFALGAVLAAEFIIGKTGYFEMKDLLKFN